MFKLQHLTPSLRHVRQKSLWESVTQLLARDKKAAETEPAVSQDENRTVVGKAAPRSRVIGFEIGARPRLSGSELQKALKTTFEQHPQARGLELAQLVTMATGRRVPDVILNKNAQADISRYFEQKDKEAAQAAKLTFSETLPSNVRTK